jgi:predicted MPP superfamily phosphohydrolase
MRIAAIADIHCNTTSHDLVRSLFAQMAQRADIVLLCGDLVDGLPEEAAVLAKEISSLKIPTSQCWAITSTSPARKMK